MFPLIWLTGYTWAVELRAFVAVPRITLKCDHLPLCTLDSSGSHLIFLTDWCAQIKGKEIEAYRRTYFTSPAERCLSTSNTYSTSLFLELHCSVYFAREKTEGLQNNLMDMTLVSTCTYMYIFLDLILLIVKTTFFHELTFTVM